MLGVEVKEKNNPLVARIHLRDEFKAEKYVESYVEIEGTKFQAKLIIVPIYEFNVILGIA